MCVHGGWDERGRERGGHRVRQIERESETGIERWGTWFMHTCLTTLPPPTLSKCFDTFCWEASKSAPHTFSGFVFHPGCWTEMMARQAGWELHCHWKQSSAYSWNEITPTMALLCFWSRLSFFLNCKSFDWHLFLSFSLALCPLLTAKVQLQRSRSFLPRHKKTGFVINISTLF